MNKLYMLTMACILCMAVSHAQTRYWRGPANGNWNNTANWATTAVAAPGASVPNATGFTAIFDQGTPLVNVDMGTFSLLSLVVTNNITAKLYSAAAVQLTVEGNGSPDYGLRIDLGSRLEDSAAANVPFNVTFGNAAQALVDGTWYFSGHSSVVGGNGAFFTLPGAGATTKVDVNGTMIIGEKAFASSSPAGTTYLNFNAGSEFRLARDASFTPRAIWATSSTIRITGTQTAGPVINGLVTNSIGNLVFDCPGVMNEIGWSLTPNLLIKGNFQILNTNSQNLVLGTSSTGGGTIVNYEVGGNMLVSGTSWVTLGNKNTNPLADKNLVFQVNGNFEQTGGTFNLRDAIITSATRATELKIKGNFTQTAGVFGCPSTAGAGISELFFVELNGTTVQNINISSGTIDNVNNGVTLRMNNSNGAVLAAPLSVGRISWNTAGKGKMVAGSNLFTINNALNDGLAVNSPGANAYITGPVARRTSAAVAYSIPTGTAAAYRPVEVIPSAATLSTYQAQYFAGAYATPTASLPLSKVSGAEYWDVQKVSGSDAAVRLTLGAAVPGVTSADKLVVAHFNGATWVTAKGATGTEISPGNSPTGSATSEVMSSFSPFTFGVLPGSPLPVFLVSLNARKISNTAAKLDWIITASSNPDKFEILRSDDGSHFTAIGTVKAAAQQLTFTYQDNQLPKKTAFYQLRMIDQQGVVTMSKIVSVFNNAEGWVINSMMPTLVSSQAKLNISASSGANLRLAVTDMYGRVIYQQQTRLSAGSQDVWLNLSMLPAGAYQVTGVLDNGLKTGSVRFVKQ